MFDSEYLGSCVHRRNEKDIWNHRDSGHPISCRGKSLGVPLYDVVDFSHGLYARTRIDVLLIVQAGSLGMQAQNIGITDGGNTLHTGEPTWGRPGVSPTGGTRQDLQQTIAIERGAIVAAPSATLDFELLEFGFQRRHIKLSAWGTRCRQWSRSFELRNIKVLAWGTRCRQWSRRFELRNIKVLAWGSCCRQRSGALDFEISRV